MFIIHRYIREKYYNNKIITSTAQITLPDREWLYKEYENELYYSLLMPCPFDWLSSIAANLGFDALQSAPPSERTVEKRDQISKLICFLRCPYNVAIRKINNERFGIRLDEKKWFTFKASRRLNVFLHPWHTFDWDFAAWSAWCRLGFNSENITFHT